MQHTRGTSHLFGTESHSCGDTNRRKLLYFGLILTWKFAVSCEEVWRRFILKGANHVSRRWDTTTAKTTVATRQITQPNCAKWALLSLLSLPVVESRLAWRFSDEMGRFFMSAAGGWAPPRPPPSPQQQHSHYHVTYTENRLSSFCTRLFHFSHSIVAASVQRHTRTLFSVATAFDRHGRWAVSIKKKRKKERTYWILVMVFTCAGSKCSRQFSWRRATERVNGQSHLTERQWGYSERSQHSKCCRWCFYKHISLSFTNKHWDMTKCSTECCVRGPVGAEPLAVSAGSPLLLFSDSAFWNVLAHCCPVFVCLFSVYSRLRFNRISSHMYNESLEASNLKSSFQSWSRLVRWS